MNEAESRDPEDVCNVDDCNAWRQGDHSYCYHHKGLEQGPKSDNGAPENNANATSHWLHSSAETFFENADESHLDTYYAIHESLCTRYEELHGILPEHIKKDLAEIAFEMAKLDMAKEYEARNAAHSDLPLTENQTIDFNPDTMQEVEIEQVSKVESLKTDIRRENRLALKDMGIYRSPEKQAAEAKEDLASLWAAELRD